MVSTINGDMDESELVKREGMNETDEVTTFWVEYRVHSSKCTFLVGPGPAICNCAGDGDPVHRSVHAIVKHGNVIGSLLGRL